MEVNWSVVALEVLNFGILVVILRRFLFAPVRSAIEGRRKEIEAQRIEIEARETAVSTARSAYERKMHGFDEEARARLATVLADGRARAAEVIDEAAAKARRLTTVAAEESDTARRRALEDLRGEVFKLAADAAARVIRGIPGDTLTKAYARLAARSLQTVFDGLEDRPKDPIAVFVSNDVDVDEIRGELLAILGQGARFAFEVDPEIVAGVRLRTHGHEVEASASATLAAWYAEQVSPDATAVAAYGHTG